MSLGFSIVGIIKQFFAIKMEATANSMTMAEYTLVVFQGSFSFIKRIAKVVKQGDIFRFRVNIRTSLKMPEKLMMLIGQW